MKHFVLSLLGFILCAGAQAQPTKANALLDQPALTATGEGAATTAPGLERFTQYLRYADSHIHPTYKHYFRYRTDKEMRSLLHGAVYGANFLMPRYHRVSGPAVSVACSTLVGFKREVVEQFKLPDYSNWTPNPSLKKGHLRRGQISTLLNYDQAGYPEIQYVPGSLLCNSYSPYEKQFALQGFKRIVSHLVVTRMGLRRLKAYGQDAHTPYNDFLAEYYFNLLQDEEKRLLTRTPVGVYSDEAGPYSTNPPYRNCIRMVRDSQELARCLDHNDQVLRSGGWLTDKDEPLLYTPLLMSIEGGQVLYGPKSAQNRYILNPLNAPVGGRFYTAALEPELQSMRSEILDNAVRIKNLPHRLFFITLGHFAQNHVVGFAKTLDRDPESVEHRVIKWITRSPKARNNLLRKTYAGFNPGCERTTGCTTTPFGMDVATTFLDPRNTFYDKPTYIDVKHMDVQGRIEYYYRRRELEQELRATDSVRYKNLRLPIIASHFGVSGESQALAAATGLRPNFDKYEETEDPEDYYEDDILLNNKAPARARFWKNFMWGIGYDLNKRRNHLTVAERQMYRPLDFTQSRAAREQDTAAYDPFVNFKINQRTAGWYYPWSINLFDEEIIEINKSDGIIGLLLDPRQLGAFMPKYQDVEKRFAHKFEAEKAALKDEVLATYFLTRDELTATEYFKLEPLLRNWFYIVQLIKQQRINEQVFIHTGQRPPGFVPEPEVGSTTYKDGYTTYKDAWATVNIGSDFDGLIDPFNAAPTAAYMPDLRRRLVAYAYLFAQVHADEFSDPATKRPLLSDLQDSQVRLEQLFYGNLTAFARKYF